MTVGLPNSLLTLLETEQDLNVVFMKLMPLLGEILACDRCFLYIRDPIQSQGQITHCWSNDGQEEGWIGADWIEDPTTLADPLMTIALSTPEAVFVEDIETVESDIVDLSYEREVFQHRALIHAPIYYNDALVGVLECSVFDYPRQWTSNDRALITALQTKLSPLVLSYGRSMGIIAS